MPQFTQRVKQHQASTGKTPVGNWVASTRTRAAKINRLAAFYHRKKNPQQTTCEIP
jgi:hypothetical protein